MGIKQVETYPLVPVNGGVEPDDIRTNEQIRAEHLAMISNALDLPPGVIDQTRLKLISRTNEFRDFIMDNVVPTVLAVNPAMVSVQQMIPRLFENGEDLEVDLPTDNLATFAQATGILAARIKLMEMLGIPEEARQRLLARLIPPPAHQPPQERR